MPTLHVTDRDGSQHTINAESSSNLMEVLQAKMLVEGTCGGVASCGTCHVYFADADVAGERTEDEGYMLEALEDHVEVRESSRLCCQVNVADALDGAAITIAPEA